MMKKRIKQLYEENRKLLTRKERDVINNYLKGYKRIDKEISRIYKNYADSDGKLYMAEMLKYDRIKKTEHDVAKAIAKIYKTNNKLTRGILRDVMNKSYSTVTQAANEVTGKRVPTIAKDVIITEEVNKLVAGIKWSDRNNKHKSDLIYKAHGLIKDGLEEGKTYNTMAKELQEALGKDIEKPMRIIRTESHRISEAGKLKAAEDLKKNNIIMEKTWLTMGDERVRSSHQYMDGQTVGIDEEFEFQDGTKTKAPGLSGKPEEDIHCRCIATYNIKQ